MEEIDYYKEEKKLINDLGFNIILDSRLVDCGRSSYIVKASYQGKAYIIKFTDKEDWFSNSFIPEKYFERELNNKFCYRWLYIYEYIDGQRFGDLTKLTLESFKSIIEMYVDLLENNIWVMDLNEYNICFNKNTGKAYFIDLGALKSWEDAKLESPLIYYTDVLPEERKTPDVWNPLTENIEIYCLGCMLYKKVNPKDLNIKRIISKMYESKLCNRYKTFKEILEDINQVF